MELTDDLIEKLAEKRKVFHSEDDLKFELGYLIKTEFPSSQIRLEKPVDLIFNLRDNYSKLKHSRAAVDIVVIVDGLQIPIEIKYKTLALAQENKKSKSYFVGDEAYLLANQGASDLGRFNFRKDIARIEKFISNESNNAAKGYCLIITNDPSYLSDPTGTLIENYSLADNITLLKKDKGWKFSTGTVPNKSHWTFKGDLKLDLRLQYEYSVKWKDYSQVEKGSNKIEPLNKDFKYLLIKVPS